MSHAEHRETFSCTDCDDFELEKSFSGRAGTPGEEEYDRIEAPDECPACGGEIERDIERDDGEPVRACDVLAEMTGEPREKFDGSDYDIPDFEEQEMEVDEEQ